MLVAEAKTGSKKLEKVAAALGQGWWRGLVVVWGVVLG